MDEKLKLKEEQIELIKRMAQRDNVMIRRDIYTKNITVTLPVQVEDLIIEREVNGKKDTLRIPVSEETYEHVKKTVIHNEIDVYKKYIRDIKRIDVDLDKEQLMIKENFNHNSGFIR